MQQIIPNQLGLPSDKLHSPNPLTANPPPKGEFVNRGQGDIGGVDYLAERAWTLGHHQSVDTLGGRTKTLGLDVKWQFILLVRHALEKGQEQDFT